MLYHWFRLWVRPRSPLFFFPTSAFLFVLFHASPLTPTAADCVISTDEKTSIQARKRGHPTLAAWDVRRAKIFGRCARKTGIAPFERLVRQVMSQEHGSEKDIKEFVEAMVSLGKKPSLPGC